MSNDQYYGGQQYDPYANQGQGADEVPRSPDVTQTWEGQTWDTQYQPAVSYEQVQAARAAQTQPQEHPEAPVAPVAPVAYGAQEAYQPQQSYEQQHQSYEQYPSYGGSGGYYAEPQSGPRSEPHEVSAPAAAPAPAWSSPTTSGNGGNTGNAAPMTAAQRARAEGRSPVIEPGMLPAALTAVLGLLLAGGAALGTYGLLVPLVLLQGLTAAGWFRLNGMWPARQGIALAFAGGLAADAALLASGREHAAAAILGTLGVWVLLCLVLQLRSHADPDERMYGLMATIASAALTVIATGHLGAAPDAVVVGGVAVAAAVLARALPLPGPVSLVAALLASAGAGIAAGGFTDLGTSGALLGLGAGVCALVGLRVASYDYPSRFVHMTAGVALPLTAAAPAVYLLGRALA
ncbi:hypothetical protein [Streptomyces sp. NPDC093795]|uniref:hypothetical protein n=1 Tax=Streptomyces sp. NPDC093795 TaxID=3366051 RepID=UPI0037F96FB9